MILQEKQNTGGHRGQEKLLVRSSFVILCKKNAGRIWVRFQGRSGTCRKEQPNDKTGSVCDRGSKRTVDKKSSPGITSGRWLKTKALKLSRAERTVNGLPALNIICCAYCGQTAEPFRRSNPFFCIWSNHSRSFAGTFLLKQSENPFYGKIPAVW